MEQQDYLSIIKTHEFPSSNGISNAHLNETCGQKKRQRERRGEKRGILIQNIDDRIHSLAALASACANGGKFKDAALFSPRTIQKMTTSYDNYEVDQVFGTIVPFTHGGFGKFTPTSANSPPCYGWGGAGGIMVRFFPTLNLSFAYLFSSFFVHSALFHTFWLSFETLAPQFRNCVFLIFMHPYCFYRYVTNRMGVKLAFNDPRPNLLLTAVLECIGKV